MNFKLSDRERWLLFLTAAMAVIYIIYRLAFDPMLTKITASRIKLWSLRNELTVIQGKVVLLQRLELTPLERLRARKGREQQVMEALRYLSMLVSQEDLELSSIQPSTAEKMVDSAKAVVIELKLRGSYQQLYRFLQAMEKLPILIISDHISINRVGNGIIDIVLSLSVYY